MTTLPEDPYKILGVDKDAQISEIRSAHRKLVLKCHPDKVQDPALRAEKQDEFQKVQQAYELLTDEKERQKYDDQVKLAETRKQTAKTNVSTPRATSKYTEYEVRTPESRPASYQSGGSVPSATKPYSYARSWDDEMAQGPRIFEPASSRPSRRESKYSDIRPKRDGERERERERERDKEKESRERDKEREKERERERRSRKADKSDKEDSSRRSEKEPRRAEKKSRDKVREKEVKRDSEDKKKPSKVYIEDFDELAPRSEKKKSASSSSNSKKYEEKRDRSNPREEVPQTTRTFTEYATSTYESPRVPPPPETTWSQSIDLKASYATSYIEASRAKETVPGLKRSMTYHRMDQPPAAPTPPPVPSQASPFSLPDEQDDARRPARPRRGSSESTRLQRDKSYRKPSREPVDEPVLSASPSTRPTAQFQRATSSTAPAPGSPPRISRTNSMPSEAAYLRSVPIRSQTLNSLNSYPESGDTRGRNRSRMQPQINEESDSDEIRTRDRKHRSSRQPRNRTPEPIYVDARYSYDVRQGSSYSRRPETDNDTFYYSTSGGRSLESRPTMPSRDGGYSTSTGSAHFTRVKTSKSYGYDDVQYTHHQKPREEHPVYG